MTTRLNAQFAAFAAAALLTFAMLGSVELLATSKAPAGLVAQMSQTVANT